MSRRDEGSRYDDFLDALKSSVNLSSSRSKIAGDYTFDANSGSVTIPNLDAVDLVYIINKTRGEIIYDPSNVERGGISIGNSVDLIYDTSSYADSDNLLVMYEARNVNDDVVSISIMSILNELQSQTRLLRKIVG